MVLRSRSAHQLGRTRLARRSVPKHKSKSLAKASPRPTSLRHINARELYLLLRANSPCSRADLVRLSGLSGPTVSRTIEYLEKRGLVISLGFGESDGGRPPDQLSLNQGYVYVAGLEIKDSGIRVALADLQGNRIAQWSSRLPSRKTPEKVVEALVAGVERLLKQHSIAKRKLYAICTSAPGITDVSTGNLIFAPFLKDLGDFPLSQLLENAFAVPVIVDNESNLHALGERAYGAAKGEDHFVFLEVGNGIGAGIFIHGMLYRGATGGAGEIGYMQVPSAPRGPFSTRLPGTLERVAGGKGMEETWRRLSKNRNARKSATAADILGFAEAGDRLALQVIETAAKALCDVIANISVLLDPTMIVLGGPFGSSPLLFDAVTRQIQLQKHDLGRIRLRPSLCGKDAALLGAVKTALEVAETRLLNFALN
jgi:glucokinase